MRIGGMDPQNRYQGEKRGEGSFSSYMCPNTLGAISVLEGRSSPTP